jgi:hypothetical protein
MLTAILSPDEQTIFIAAVLVCVGACLSVLKTVVNRSVLGAHLCWK